MDDDKARKLPLSGLVVLMPRGRQVGESGQDGAARREAQDQSSEDDIQVGAEHVRAYHLAGMAVALFERAHWPIDHALSWIGWRDPLRIEQLPGLHGRERLIEKRHSAVVLLQALKDGTNGLRAIRLRNGLVDRMSADEWAIVPDGVQKSKWSGILQHEVMIDRRDMLRLWPAMSNSVTIVHEPVVIKEALQPCKAPKSAPWKMEHFEQLKTWIVENAMPQELTREEFHVQLQDRYGTVDRHLSRALHQDADVHPRKPGRGPRKSAASFGKK